MAIWTFRLKFWYIRFFQSHLWNPKKKQIKKKEEIQKFITYSASIWCPIGIDSYLFSVVIPSSLFSLFFRFNLISINNVEYLLQFNAIFGGTCKIELPINDSYARFRATSNIANIVKRLMQWTKSNVWRYNRIFTIQHFANLMSCTCNL